MVHDPKDIMKKIHPPSYANTHHEGTDLKPHGTAINTETEERFIVFLWNKKTFALCFRGTL